MPVFLSFILPFLPHGWPQNDTFLLLYTHRVPELDRLSGLFLYTGTEPRSLSLSFSSSYEIPSRSSLRLQPFPTSSLINQVIAIVHQLPSPPFPPNPTKTPHVLHQSINQSHSPSSASPTPPSSAPDPPYSSPSSPADDTAPPSTGSGN